MTAIHRIPLAISNAFLVMGPVNILIDTGSPGEGKKIVHFLKRHKLELRDVALILHTHGHSDHCGSTRELLDYCKIPTAIHSADLKMVTTGSNGPIATTSLFSKILVPFVDKPYDPFKPDHLLDDMTNLSSFGMNASIVHTPGHSMGSVSIEFDNGNMVIGDVLMGGFLGGIFFPTWPSYHYFIENRELLDRSINKILSTQAMRFWVGHGGPLKKEEVTTWYHNRSTSK